REVTTTRFHHRISRVRQLRQLRPSHPAPTPVTIAKRPSEGSGMSQTYTRFALLENRIFLARGMDTSGKSELTARRPLRSSFRGAAKRRALMCNCTSENP